MNEIKIEFQDSGNVKFETGQFSPAVHGAADKFLDVTIQALGAANVEKTRAKHTHSHGAHTHQHDHQH